jgi:hypothetical protein
MSSQVFVGIFSFLGGVLSVLLVAYVSAATVYASVESRNPGSKKEKHDSVPSLVIINLAVNTVPWADPQVSGVAVQRYFVHFCTVCTAHVQIQPAIAFMQQSVCVIYLFPVRINLNCDVSMASDSCRQNPEIQRD